MNENAKCLRIGHLRDGCGIPRKLREARRLGLRQRYGYPAPAERLVLRRRAGVADETTHFICHPWGLCVEPIGDPTAGSGCAQEHPSTYSTAGKRPPRIEVTTEPSVSKTRRCSVSDGAP